MRKDSLAKDVLIASLHEEVKRLQQLRIEDRDDWAKRSEERAERAVVLLTRAADTMEALPRQVERTLGMAREATTREQQEQLIQELRTTVNDIKQIQRDNEL